MPEIFNVIQSEGIELINNTRANLGASGQNATNQTSQSLRIQITQEGTKYKMQYFGRPFFMTVQTGRRPTPNKKPSAEMIDNLKKWINARGIDESAVWAIANKINQKGTELWRSGGRKDIVDPAVDQFVNEIGQGLLDAEAENFQLKIRGMEW